MGKMPIRSRVLACLALLAGSALIAGEPPTSKPVPGIDVVVRYSVEVLDPLKPGESFVECVVRNKSAKAVAVPTVYVAGHAGEMALRATERWDLRLVSWAGPQKQVFETVKPGHELAVFKAPLRDIFLLDVTQQKPLKAGEKRWYWSWSA